LRLLHKDVGDVLAGLVDHLRFNPESRFVNFILGRASILDDRLLRRIGEVVFIYAGLDLVEGVGLYLEQVWAEYLTLAITASFLPWEIFEVFRKLTLPRVGLLVVNALVFFYLIKLVAGHGKASAQLRGGRKLMDCKCLLGMLKGNVFRIRPLFANTLFQSCLAPEPKP